jgi:hypothetical protein
VSQIYSIDRKDCAEEDFVQVSPVANVDGMWAAVVLFHGTLGPFFTSTVSLADAKAMADEWVRANLNATTSYRRDLP